MTRRLMLLAFPLACEALLSADPAPKRPRSFGVAHIAFYVSDLAKARWFWTELLGYQGC